MIYRALSALTEGEMGAVDSLDIGSKPRLIRQVEGCDGLSSPPSFGTGEMRCLKGASVLLKLK